MVSVDVKHHVYLLTAPSKEQPSSPPIILLRQLGVRQLYKSCNNTIIQTVDLASNERDYGYFSGPYRDPPVPNCTQVAGVERVCV